MSRLKLVIVDHKIDFLDRLCDRLVVLQLGRVVADGPARRWSGTTRPWGRRLPREGAPQIFFFFFFFFSPFYFMLEVVDLAVHSDGAVAAVWASRSRSPTGRPGRSARPRTGRARPRPSRPSPTSCPARAAVTLRRPARIDKCGSSHIARHRAVPRCPKVRRVLPGLDGEREPPGRHQRPGLAGLL